MRQPTRPLEGAFAMRFAGDEMEKSNFGSWLDENRGGRVEVRWLKSKKKVELPVGNDDDV